VNRVVALALLTACAVGCEREPKLEAAEVTQTSGVASEVELDLGAIRVSIVDGLEAAVRDPAVAQQLGLAARLETPEAEAALERLLARATADPELNRIADEFFRALQDSPAMRAALLEHARQNPEFVASDLGALRETFVADVERRLTREELAVLLEQQLHVALRDSDELLAEAWLSEAGGASALATVVLARLEHPEFRGKLVEWLGRDGLQSVLVRRFADPKRATELLLGVAPTLVSAQGLVEILDHQTTAQLLASALGRSLQDEQIRIHCEELFALALAAEFDASAFTQVLSKLSSTAALSREAAALLSAVAREPVTRAVVEREIEGIAGQGQANFDALLLQTLD
jgi:hypothetical protein